jgi:hypothetical protein
MDDVDKLPSFDTDEAPRRSTSSLDSFTGLALGPSCITELL